MENESTILKVKNVSKIFPGVKALDSVSLEVKRGEVLALLGENGAGKSTLINVLSGVHKLDEGQLYFEGKPLYLSNPQQAKDIGINVVHQELSYVSMLSVAENLYINNYGDSSSCIVDWKHMYHVAQEALDTVGLKIDIKKPIGSYDMAIRQLIEIARAIYSNAKVIILDEPSSALNDEEIEVLMECIENLRKRNIAVILITHKIEEIMRIADRVIVLRDGKIVGERNVCDTNKDDLTSLMIGRKITDMYPKKTNCPKDVVLRVENVSTNILKDISFTVRKGEILGVYGLMGSGHLELGKTLFGTTKVLKGRMIKDGQQLNAWSPQICLRKGIAFLPSDRKTEGLVLMHNIRQNIMIPYYQINKKRKLINVRTETEVAKKWIRLLNIKTPSEITKAGVLSGGNQQKVVLAKWLELNPEIIILNDPTRGIDVGSKAEIYKLLNDLAANGVSIIMITSEMPELLAMSDRILVMYNGQVKALLNKREMTQRNVVTAAIGG